METFSSAALDPLESVCECVQVLALMFAAAVDVLHKSSLLFSDPPVNMMDVSYSFL
jgi:hypothetical protein